MKAFTHSSILQAFILLLSFFGVKESFGQDKLNWHYYLGAGIMSMRDFNSSFKDLYYKLPAENGSIQYEIREKPSFLINAGIGLSGTFGDNPMLGWETGLNIRSGGFQIRPSILELKGDLSQFSDYILPTFGQTKTFRYWALHVPLSLNYMPFEVIGFTIGGDLYYQLSPNPTHKEFPHGELGKAMGFPSLNTPDYQHPFHLGGHLGIFAPVGEKVRLELLFISDIIPRLTVKDFSSSYKFREQGILLNAKYKLK